VADRSGPVAGVAGGRAWSRRAPVPPGAPQRAATIAPMGIPGRRRRVIVLGVVGALSLVGTGLAGFVATSGHPVGTTASAQTVAHKDPHGLRARQVPSTAYAPVGVAVVPTPDGDGYWEATNTGAVFSFGDAAFYGSMGGQPLNQPIVAMASTRDGKGYWLFARDGGVFSFGDAVFDGSAGDLDLAAPIVGAAVDPATGGYWLVAADGGIFSYGAGFFGSMGGKPLNAPIAGMAAAPGGKGYWLVAADGGVFSFGNAGFFGSAGGLVLAAPVVGLAPSASGGGYWMVASDGGVLSYGDAGFYGSMGGQSLAEPVVGLSAGPSGKGYWMADADGGIYSFGTAGFFGSAAPSLNQMIISQLASTGGARQVIVVDGDSMGSTSATLSTYENDGAGWYQVLAPVPAVIGFNGWSDAADRVEGDETTPIGLYPIGMPLYGADPPPPGLHAPYHQFVCGDWWDEDPSDATYNTFQEVPCGSPGFGGGSEALWTEGNAYPYMAVIDFNTPPTGPYGSAIFLHADIGSPTDGCVSVELSALLPILQWLNPALDPVIVMGPDPVVRSF
jgi:L,D-peptidoglycan transpeptidase YkuD (ErfK/YbiS/YcfS/YnhG family)